MVTTPSRSDIAHASTACLIVARLLLAPVDQELAGTLRTTLPHAWRVPDSKDAITVLLEAVSSGTPEEWEAEYFRAFRDPAGATTSPYESVHTEEDELVNGASATNVESWYHSFGLSAPREGYEPSDHIGLEMQLLGMVLDAAASAPTDSETAELLHRACEFSSAHPLSFARESIAGPLRVRVSDPVMSATGALLDATLSVVSRFCKVSAAGANSARSE